MNDVPRVECLTEGHDIAGFACGVESLDRWLRNEGRSAHKSGASRTHVWVGAASSTVLAYFTITPTTVAPGGLSKKLRGGVSGPVPGYLLAKLALGESLRGSIPKLGPILLLDALAVVLTAADAAGGRLLVVDTLEEAAHSFYKRHDFVPIEGTDRLVLKIEAVRQALNV